MDTYSSYQWYDQDGIIEGAIFNQYIIEQSGTYYLEVTNEYGCKAMSAGVGSIKTATNNLIKKKPNIIIISNPNDGNFR